jgi:GT2 family glycosyltransferase
MNPDSITVAVAACGRPAALARCLRAVASGSCLPGEVIVVDQAPSIDARRLTTQLGSLPVRYVEQERLGLSASRNLALSLATRPIIAVTDDDCVPDPGWVEAIAAAHAADPRPAAVSGPILALGPRRPGTHAVSLRESLRAVDYTGAVLPWVTGSGANFAASCQLLREHGGWDERLGTGSAGKAAEDADLLYRLLRAGGLVRYEPLAVVRHDWQTRASRLSSRWSYAHGVGALCGIWLRRRDRFAVRMLIAYSTSHVRKLAGALWHLDGMRVDEHLRALLGLVPGVVYGLHLAPRGPGPDAPP